MKNVNRHWNVQIFTIIAMLLLFTLSTNTIAANNPGHDTLYIEQNGDSVLTGNLNISYLLTAEGNIWLKSYIDLLANGSTITSSPSRNTIIGTNTHLEIDTPSGNAIYLNKYGGTIYTGSTSARTDLNVSGNLYIYNPTGPSQLTVGNIAVCLANGTNCINGANTGNVTSITESGTTPLTISSSTGDVAIGITIPTCSPTEKLTYDGSAFQCSADIDTNGGSNSAGGWTNTTTTTSTALDVNVDSTTLYVNASSNSVGIGTSGPTSELEIYTASAQHPQFRIKTGGDIPVTLGAYSDANEAFLDLTNGGVTNIHFEASGNSYFNSGSLGIGTTAPTDYYTGADNLVIYEAGDAGITIATGTTNAGALYFADGTAGDAEYRGGIAYIHAVATERLGLVSGGTEKLTILSGGNTGIGTTAPTSTLQIIGTTNTTYLTIASATQASCDLKAYANGTVYCGTDATGTGGDGTGGWTNTTIVTSTSLDVNVDGGSLFVNATSNNVGIGTTTPASKLDVTTTSGVAAQFTNTDTTNGYGVAINAGGTAATRYALAVRSVDTNTPYLYVTTETGKVGYVGIGTIAPGATLDVQGTSAIGTAAAGAYLKLEGKGGTTYPWDIKTTGATVLGLAFESQNGIAKVVFLDSGNVGIGTILPTSTLQVNGTANVTYLTIASATQSSCDLKAYTNGTIYCGTDSTGNTVDGTGGWTNTTTQTMTKGLDINITNSTGSSIIYVDSSTRNVGIGTIAPTSNLDIYATTPTIRASTSSASGTTALDLGYATSATSKARLSYTVNTAVTSLDNVYQPTVSGQVYGDIQLRTYPAGGASPTTALIIKGYTSYVGIATTTPTSTLQVIGTTNTTYLTIASATDALCDLKAHTNGTIYCGVDADTNSGGIGNGNITNNAAAGYIPQVQNSTQLNNSVIYQLGSSIGIGITNPSDLLQLNKAVGPTALRISADNYGTYWKMEQDSAGLNFHYNQASGTPSLIIGTTGNVGIGTTTPSQKLHVAGNLNVSGNILYGGNLSGYGADFAEKFTMAEQVYAGDVVCLNEKFEISKCTEKSQTSVAGVVSDRPTITGNAIAKNSVPVGIVGIVTTKVKGPVKRFDLLTTSTKPGYAQKANVSDFGAIVGKAMEDCKTECEIKVLIGLR